MKRFKMRTKLLLIIIPIVILSVVITGIFSYFYTIKTLRKNAYYSQSNIVRHTADILNNEFSKVLEDMVVVRSTSACQRLLLGKDSDRFVYDHYDDIVRTYNLFSDCYSNRYPMVDSIYLRSSGGAELTLLKDYIPQGVGVDVERWFDKYKVEQKNYYWLGPHKDEIFRTTSQRQVMTLFELIGSVDSDMHGLLAVNLNVQYFMDFLNQVDISQNGYTALITPEGILCSGGVRGDEKILEALGGQVEESYFTAEDDTGRNMLVTAKRLKNQWMLATIVPEEDVLYQVNSITYITVGIAVILIILFSAAAIFLSNSFTRPVSQLSAQVKKMEEGDYTVRFDANGNYELGVLAKGLTSLENTTVLLLEQVKNEQEQKRRAEITALQAQINPHFLYNTLSSIKHLIDMNENERAGAMMLSLSRFFRIALSRGREIIMIGEELEHMKCYLTIMNMRYSNDFNFRVEVDEEILSGEICKLVLQPVVENAIYHGIKGIGKRCEIIVSGYRENDHVILEVFDDGVGIEPRKLESIQRLLNGCGNPDDKEGSYGLKNVHDRVRLHFGKDCGLTIESIPNEYTVVRMKIGYVPYQSQS